jgi:uncharacterized protein (TIGR01244 family)
MDIRQLTPRYFVSPQIDPTQLDALRDAGITHILCNRPDFEVPPSHQAAAIKTAAEAAGMTFADQPLTHQTMVPDVIATNKALGADTDNVTLAYCASGTRSCIAWALGVAGSMPVDDIVNIGAAGGYDLRGMRSVLDKPYTDA